MTKKLSNGERKKARRALNKIKKELEELLGEKVQSKGSSQMLNYSTNFCPVVTSKQIQIIAENTLGRKLKKDELVEVVQEAYVQDWQRNLVNYLKEAVKKKLC